MGRIVELFRLAQLVGVGTPDSFPTSRIGPIGLDDPGPAVPEERRKDQRPMGTYTKSDKANPVESPSAAFSEVPTSPVASSGANQYSMIGKSISIKGEIVASDPVYIYGSVEGSINALEHRVTVGKEGRVKADISAREVVIMGDVCGNLEGGERVEIRSDGSLMGNLATRRVYIEEGAVLSGVIDVRKPSKKEKAEVRGEHDEEAESERGSLVSFPVTEMVEEIAS
jgi:cytoskeletal protein CcmA (bactofilin family)